VLSTTTSNNWYIKHAQHFGDADVVKKLERDLYGF
jgi:hypothetical protein